MNCDTGQITNNRELIKAWKDRGDRVVELPVYSEEEFTTPPVTSTVTVGGPCRSELLDALGAEIVNAAEDARQAQEVAAREFVERVNAAQQGRPYRRCPKTGLKLRV